MRRSRPASFAGPVVLSLVAGCAARPPPTVRPGPTAALVARTAVLQDSTPKRSLRLVPPEVYLRTYIQLFGAPSPLDAAKRARGPDGNGVFDAWNDYVSALGFPDYRLDIPRQTQTNALMVATFERLGIALCDRAVEHDLRGDAPLAERVVFAFDAPQADLVESAFLPRFDVLHRTFLGYPATLAPPERTARFFRIYSDIVHGHSKAAPRSRLTPREAGWAAVCYGLIRHPEFQLY